MKQAEQSSTSTEVPKTKLALLDKYKEEPKKEITKETNSTKRIKENKKSSNGR